ncbi:MAG: energy transducer TonB [Chitinophagaceae bacterium]
MQSDKENMDWDDIVFEHRNKEYGAYLIRKGYRKRFAWSLVIAVVFVSLLAIVLDMGKADFIPPPPPKQKNINVHIREFQMPRMPKDRKEPTPSKQKETVKSKASKIEHEPTITDNVQKENNRVTVRPVVSDNLAIDDVDAPDIDVKPFVKPEKQEKKELPMAPVEDITEKVASTKVQSLPHYPGGDSAWYQYLRKNLNINTVLRNRAMPSAYTAIVAFIVHPDSTTSDFRIVKDPGFGTGAEALRVIRQSGKWIPGMKDGKPVTFAQLQTVVFKVND